MYSVQEKIQQKQFKIYKNSLVFIAEKYKLTENLTTTHYFTMEP